MACERIQRLIGVYRELDRSERRMVNEHLRGCRVCQAAWQDELRVRAYVRTDRMVEPSRGFESRLLNIPRQIAAPSPMTAWLRGIGLAVAALVGTALVMQIAGLGLPTVALPTPTFGPAGSAVPGRPATVGDVLARPQAIARTTAVDLAEDDRAAAPLGIDGGASPLGAKTASRPLSLPSGASRPAGGGKNPQRIDAVGGEPPAAPAQARPVDEPPAEDDEPRDEPSEPGGVEPQFACVVVTVTLFADLAGHGGLDCEGCDGRWTDEDDAEAARRRLGLPTGMQLLLYAGDAALVEQVVEIDGSAARQVVVLSGCDVPAGAPIHVQLVGLSEGWALCPSSPNQVEVQLDGEGRGRAQFGLRAECPVLAPPPASTELPTPSAGEPPPPTEVPPDPGLIIRP